MKFGVRQIVNVVFRAKQGMTIGKNAFSVGEPVFYLDSAKTSTLEGAATTVYATGGRGNTRLVSWEGQKTLTFTVEDALLSPVSFAMLSGAGLIKGDSTEYIHFHQTTMAMISSTTTDGTTTTEINLSDALETGDYLDPTAPIFVMKTDAGGDLTGEKYTGFTVGTGTDSKKLTWTKPQDDEDAEAPSGSVFVDYYVLKTANTVSELQIDAENFAGSYYVEADTLFRTQDGKDLPANLTLPNVKIQSNFTFTMASTGDPSTFTFTMDASPGYTYFDKTKKILCAIQVVDDKTDKKADAKSVFKHGSDLSTDEEYKGIIDNDSVTNDDNVIVDKWEVTSANNGNGEGTTTDPNNGNGEGTTTDPNNGNGEGGNGNGEGTTTDPNTGD